MTYIVALDPPSINSLPPVTAYRECLMRTSRNTSAAARNEVAHLTNGLPTMFDYIEQLYDMIKRVEIEPPFRRARIIQLRHELVTLQQRLPETTDPVPARTMVSKLDRFHTDLMDTLEAHIQRLSGSEDPKTQARQTKRALKIAARLRRGYASKIRARSRRQRATISHSVPA